MKKLLLTLIIMLPLISMAQSPLYGVNQNDALLRTIDTTTFLETSISMTSSLGLISGANGLAAGSCGDLYIVYKIGSARRLGTVNATTGSVSDIGLFSDNVANIAFDNTGILYAVIGDGGLASETLFTVNLSNAALTLVSVLGNGNDGESIAFCPDNNKMYHWSGWGSGSVIMETVNLTTGATTSISTGLAGINNVGSSTYAGNGQFIVGDVFDGNVKIVDTNGVVTTTTNTSTFKGLTFAPAGAAPVVDIVNTTNTTNSICSGDSVTLVCTYSSPSYEWFVGGASTGNTSNTITVGVAGTYVCQVPDVTCGTVNSNAITLNVISAPSVQIVPSGTQQFCPGDSLQLFSSPSGTTTSQWYKDGIMIPGATNAGYWVSSPGSYNVFKTNTTGCSDSAAVAVMVTMATSPNVVLTPNPTAVICGTSGTVQLSVNMGGGSIQWTKNGVNIPGAFNNNYTANSVGVYNVIKTNMSFCSDSAAVGTTVQLGTIPSATITPSPMVTFCSPATVTLTASSGGGSRQWYKDGVLIPGATGNTYDAPSQGSYNVLKTNMSGCSDSSAVPTFVDDTCALNLNELNASINFELYPNPTSGSVSIDFGSVHMEDVISIALVGVDGKLIQNVSVTELIQGTNEVDLSGVSAGTYLVRLETNLGTAVKELIVQ